MIRFAVLLPVVLTALVSAQTKPAPDGPADPKAQKTFVEAKALAKQRGQERFAIDAFKKANKEDGGNCLICDEQVVKLALEINDFKGAIAAGQDWAARAKAPKDQSDAHYEMGIAYLSQGRINHKDEAFANAEREFKTAVELDATSGPAFYGDAMALSYLKQDDAARAQFQSFLKFTAKDSAIHQRTLRLIDRPELARARMAPAFAVTTLDGKHVSLDDLTGKVVLIDFWATWCGPCREALPHLRRIAQKFSEEPLVVLSISLDKDEQKWKDFVGHNQMTWLQYRDGGWDGQIARLFQVQAIPHTFTIDADGVLQDEHIGDESIEGKLKKLCAQARQVQAQKQLASAQAPAGPATSHPPTP